MKPLTAEWLEKAEGDFAVLERECRARKRPSYDAACFHAQQCAEKYLKAMLCERGAEFPRTHDLVSLLELVLRAENPWEHFREDLAYLSEFAVAYRYPGDSASRNHALDARRRCREFRKAARLSLGFRK